MNRSVASAAVGVAVFVVAAGEFAGGYAPGHKHGGEDGHGHQGGTVTAKPQRAARMATGEDGAKEV
jgi:hypothetical protein